MKDEREREKGWDGGRGMWKRNHKKIPPDYKSVYALIKIQ
jgi:hypothetical protein